MVNLEVEITGIKPKSKQLKKMRKRAKNLRPVFEEFIKYYQEDIIPASFNTKGALMGKKWVGSQDKSGKYTKRKKADPRNKSGTGAINLKYTLDLYEAATGGKGWFQKVKKDNFIMGIKQSIIPYADRHQTGDETMPERPYFYTVDGSMPQRAITELKNRTKKYIMEGLV